MGYSRTDVKNAAKAAIRDRIPRPRRVTLLFLLLSQGPVLLVSLIQLLLITSPTGYHWHPHGIYQQLQIVNGFFFFLYLLCALFAMILSAGYVRYSLDLIRRRPSGYSALLSPLSQAGRVLRLSLLIFLFTFLWTLGLTILLAMLLALLRVILPLYALDFAALLLAFAYWGVLLNRVLRYSLAYHVLLDYPDYTARECLNESKCLMTGRRWSFCVLILSFLGWVLLAAAIFFGVLYLGMFCAVALSAVFYFTYHAALAATAISFLAGIICAAPLSLWLMSYIAAAVAGFYDCAAGRIVCAPAPPSTAGQPYHMEEPSLRSPGAAEDTREDAPSYYSGFTHWNSHRDREDPWD